MIYILSASIRSGKTTSLLNWSGTRTDVYGILTPDSNGKRVFMNAHSREQFPMEATGAEEALVIGRFIFSRTSFDKAIQVIRDAVHKNGWLVIDEIGPMELKGEGFCEVLKEVLSARKEKIILVVREGLAGEVTGHFNINTAAIINDLALINAG